MAASTSTVTAGVPPALEFAQVYEEWFDRVVRWTRALGGPEADLDDLSQEVFLVVQRQLHRFDGRNLGGWLYRITARTVSDHRRRAWFRRVLRRPPAHPVEELAGSAEDAGEELERREARRLLYQLVGKLSEKHRRAFILFEIEGYGGDEIAAMEGIPRRHRVDAPAPRAQGVPLAGGRAGDG